MPRLVRVSGGNKGIFDGPKDIGVSMSREILAHKKRDGKKSEDNCCYWSIRRIPDELNTGSKLWVASEGRWRGYFVVMGIDFTGDGVPPEENEMNGKSELLFYSDSWVEHDGGPRRPFQGYTYKVPVV